MRALEAQDTDVPYARKSPNTEQIHGACVAREKYVGVLRVPDTLVYLISQVLRRLVNMAPVVKQRPPGSSVLRKIDDFVNNSILPMAQVVECGTFPTCFTFVPIEDETLMNIMHITNSECPGFLADKQIFIEKMNRAYDMYKGVLRLTVNPSPPLLQDDTVP